MTDAPHRLALRLDRGSFTLDVDVSWSERVAVVFGPSGSGKSTLLESVLGFHRASAARVRIGGTWLDDSERGLALPPERRALGWVPQDAALFPHLSVQDNVRFGIRRAGVGSGQRLDLALEVLELSALRRRRVDQLSGGERQRVAIARAVASGPQALLLDEPLASLDLPLRARVVPFLLRIRDALELPFLYITHDPDEAMLVGDVAIVLDAGRVVAAGPPREVLWSRAVLPLSEALGLENVLEGRVVATAGDTLRVETRGGVELFVPAPARVPVDTPLRIGVRAEDILVATGAPGRLSARNVLPAVVRRCERSEGGVLVSCEAAKESLVARLTSDAVSELGIRPGAAVHLVIKAQALRRLA